MKIIKNILWDFDGVILDSMKVRDWGFEEIFKDYDKEKVDELIKYHRENGGLSRYVKIRFFYENILKTDVTDLQVSLLAEKFSALMLSKLIDENYLIKDSLKYIRENNRSYNFHIVSGSDQKELRYICEKLNINTFFKSIHGSPTHKNDLVKKVLTKNSYKKEQTILIGDSKNDYEAAFVNGLDFFGFNNEHLLEQGNVNYINDFNKFKI